ncbi:MAG: hypothetical protein RR672_03410, partial [Raoultibacter sp.]
MSKNKKRATRVSVGDSLRAIHPTETRAKGDSDDGPSRPFGTLREPAPAHPATCKGQNLFQKLFEVHENFFGSLRLRLPALKKTALAFFPPLQIGLLLGNAAQNQRGFSAIRKEHDGFKDKTLKPLLVVVVSERLGGWNDESTAGFSGCTCFGCLQALVRSCSSADVRNWSCISLYLGVSAMV